MAAPSAGGFSLFPNPSNDPRPPSRSQSRPRAATPQGRPGPSSELTPPRRRNSTARDGKPRGASNNPWQHALDARKKQPAPAESTAGPSAAAAAPEDPVVETTYSQPVTDAPQRCETAFSEAQTLVRSPSQRSRSSIAKPPIAYMAAGPSSSSQPVDEHGEPAAIRSIFPRYNPDVSLAQQDYYPTQASPTHIPQSAISRPLYSPRSAAAAAGASSTGQAGAQAANPAQAPNSHVRWPPALGQRHHEPAAIPPVCTTEELRGLWKVANGWKASSFEGRSYCLKMTASPEAPPSYTLSSSTGQPFYCLRVEPTSASALVTLSRYDPNKPFKAASPSTAANGTSSSSFSIPIPSPTPGGRSGGSPSPRASSSLSRHSNHTTANANTNVAHTPSTTAPKHQKNWQEVLATTLAASPTGSPPSDEDPSTEPGLLAHLWPSAAARLVADRANDATTVALAQAESARLVWDADSGSHFLAHPALAVPFCVTVERHPALSRVEYTLEHLESPVHLARLVRDGTGAGWVEVDTGIAGKVDAVYLVDVAVAALVLVAHVDGKKYGGGGGGMGGVGGAGFNFGGFGGGGGMVEVFEPPPVAGGGGSVYSGVEGAKRSWSRASRREEKERKRELKRQGTSTTRKGKSRMEQFELDLESQSSELGKEKEEKLPGVLRLFVGLVTFTFKCFVWSATLAFKAVLAILSGLTRCCGLGKL